eukprot:scaffold105415_cov63-Phaeocystis_antarctica.AAC.1
MQPRASAPPPARWRPPVATAPDASQRLVKKRQRQVRFRDDSCTAMHAVEQAEGGAGVQCNTALVPQ